MKRNDDGHLIMSGNELAAALMIFGVSGFVVMWILDIPIFGR